MYCFVYRFVCLLVTGLLGNEQNGREGDGEGEGGYDNPVQDMGDQYSPPDAPLNEPMDPGEGDTCGGGGWGQWRDGQW